MTARALVAELVGTFFLVLAIAGAGALDGASPALSVALAAGLALAAATWALGHVSGGHFNPAVTIGLIATGRFDSARAPAYMVAQVLGGASAALLVSVTLAGAGSARTGSLASLSNHYGAAGQFGLTAAFLIELAATALLLVVVVGATARRAPAGFAPLATGLAYAALMLVALPVTGGSLNPARSTATALLGGAVPLAQLWVFWAAPILGGVIGGVIGRYLQEE
ncbi:MAG: aquaporin [Hyphomicrobiaceae bacterium]